MLSFPFDSRVEVVENPITHEPETQFDRAVSSQPMRHLISHLFTSGIMPDISSNYLVSAGTDGMTVVVHSGFAVLDGGLALETEDRTLEVTAADTSLDRIDTVVLRWNENVDVRTCDLYIKAGTPASNPVRPELQRDNSVYEIGLADVFITRSTATITNEKITDTRYETARCGVVSSVSEFDTTFIYQQVQADLAEFQTGEEAEFLAWFNSIQDILDENVAAHLEQSKANLDGGNTFTGGNQTVQGKNINLKSTNLSRGETIESNAWGDSRLNIVDGNGNRCAFIQPLQRTTGEIDLHIEKDSNNSGGKILINGIDIEQINTSLGNLTFRNNNGVAQFSIDGGTTWKNMGGSTMKCVKFGTISNASEATVSVSAFGFSSAEDYAVILNGNSVTSGIYTTVTLTAKTKTSFTVSTGAAGTGASYQVISFVG